jgi:cytochrome P450
VLLNSSRVCQEILNKRGSLTNDRPYLPICQNVMSKNMRSVLMQQSPLYREERRVYHQLLTGSAITKYGISQDLESTQLLAEHMLKPNDWYLNHGRYANSVINLIAFGTRTLAITPLMKGILEVVHVFLRNNPPANAVDMFPELMKLPRFLQFWHRRAEAIGNRTYEVYAAYWKPVARAIHDGTAGPSFSRDVLQEEAGKFRGTEDQAMYLAAMLVEAGSDTTRAALNNLAMAMIAAPDFVKRVRAELESVCGYAERMPTFDDEEKLPLVAATIKELLRWRCIFPTTPPHRLTQDMEFEGYLFPKDTNFIINDRYISLNPEEHKYPQTFYPERWLNGKEHDVLSGLWAFGGGRKVCVGYRLAQRSLFINVAKIIYCFDFERVCSSPFPAYLVKMKLMML